jgi:hypothetical protein
MVSSYARSSRFGCRRRRCLFFFFGFIHDLPSPVDRSFEGADDLGRRLVPEGQKQLALSIEPPFAPATVELL